MPETGAWTNCDGSHYCQVCGNESCPILFHNLTLVSSSSAPQLAYPRQQTDSTAGPSVIWRLQKTLLELWLVLQGPAQLFAWFCWEPAMQIKRVPLFPVCPLWGGVLWTEVPPMFLPGGQYRQQGEISRELRCLCSVY